MKKELWPELKKLHPLVADLPDELKDPKCFKKIEKKLHKIMESDHNHKAMITFQKCKECQARFNEKRHQIKKYGFKSYEQYLFWKRIMDIIVFEREFYLPKQ